MQRKNKLFAMELLLAVAVLVGSIGCGGGGRATMASPSAAPNPAPSINTLSPNIITTKGTAFTLTVNGSNLLAGSVVRWNGSSRGTTFVNSGQLTAQISASDIAQAGNAAITVFNPAPGGGMSGSLAFVILPAIAFDSAGALDSSDAVNANQISNIWTIQGAEAIPLTKLTASGTTSEVPIWSPDGSKIAFWSQRALDGSNSGNKSGILNIWVMNADGSAAVPLTKLTISGVDKTIPAWSPDGSKIGFSSARALDGTDNKNANSTSNIWVMNADGSEAKPLTQLTAIGANSVGFHWSPDGSKIAFSSARALDVTDNRNTNSTHNVWVMNADGSGVKPLTRLTASGAHSFGPVWSPDGSKIGFQSLRALDGSDTGNTNPFNIWVINADGSGAVPLTRLTTENADCLGPVWSPDGSKIGFTSRRALNGTDGTNTNGTYNIWVVGADGSGTKPLTKLTSGTDSYGSVWLPDGSKIGFTSRRALDGSDTGNTNPYNIWVINADGSGAVPLTRLTTPAADTENPVWQP